MSWVVQISQYSISFLKRPDSRICLPVIYSSVYFEASFCNRSFDLIFSFKILLDFFRVATPRLPVIGLSENSSSNIFSLSVSDA